jgi:hypothetical protein
MKAIYAWLLEHFLTEAGWVAVRIAVDAAGAESAPAAPMTIGAQHAESLRRMWERATERGEIPGPDDPQVRLVTRMMYGDLMLRVMVDRGRLLALDADTRRTEAHFVVEMMLRMLRY